MTHYLVRSVGVSLVRSVGVSEFRTFVFELFTTLGAPFGSNVGARDVPYGLRWQDGDRALETTAEPFESGPPDERTTSLSCSLRAEGLPGGVAMAGRVLNGFLSAGGRADRGTVWFDAH